MQNKPLIMVLLLAALGLPFIAFAQTDTAAALTAGTAKTIPKAPVAIPIIRDPSTVAALQESRKQMQAIGQSCAQQARNGKGTNPRTNPVECLCAHAEDIARVNQIRSDALAALVNTSPELKDQKIRVQGAFGVLVLNSNTLKKNDAESIKKQYRCR